MLVGKGMKTTERVKQGNVICGNWIDLRCDVLNGRCFFSPLLLKKVGFLLRKESEWIIHIGGAIKIKTKAARRLVSGTSRSTQSGHCFESVNNGAQSPLKKPVAANHVGASLHSRVHQCAACFNAHALKKKKQKSEPRCGTKGTEKQRKGRRRRRRRHALGSQTVRSELNNGAANVG